MACDQAKRIAELNDQLRARVGLPTFGDDVKGKIVMTSGICSLPPEVQIDIWVKVNRYDDFNGNNDPYGEHDFGALDIPGAGKVFWKIDYYADAKCHYGSTDPSHPDFCFRVLTIMLAEEY